MRLLEEELGGLGGARLDLKLAVVLDAEGPRYASKSDCEGLHRLTARYYATDLFLNLVLGALLHPTTKGARMRVLRRLAEELGGGKGVESESPPTTAR